MGIMEGQTASSLIVGVPRETAPGEHRVAMTPDTVKRLTASGVVVKIESGAGLASGHSDDAYVAAGAAIAPDAAAAFDAQVVIKVQKPNDSEVALLRPGATIIALLQPMSNVHLIRELAGRDITAFSMDAIPRTTRAQSMDVLSSQATVAGYKAVLMAADTLPKFFPMLTTAAGSIVPAKVLVVGAGVAGLQAIATACRLGAVVEVAAETGGNFELTRAGETVEHNGVKILGQLNLPSTMPVHASQMYAKNIQNLLDLLIKNGKLDPDFEDEIVKGTVITRGRDIVHEMTKQRVAEQDSPVQQPAANQDLVSAPDRERPAGTADADGAQAGVSQDAAAAWVQDSTA